MLVVPAKFMVFTTEQSIANILEREINGRAVKYNHFELKNITFGENKFPDAVLSYTEFLE